jgi:flagellar M-ring protein FliF
MDQIKRLFLALSVLQRWTILIVGILAAAGFYELAHWQTESSFHPLYNSLAADDAALIVQKLKEGGTPYRLSSDGATISVPEDKVAELRLDMAGAGLPKSGRIGFEIFDKTNFGMTDFAEHINYRRALEGELERSVMSLSQVEQARVHISFPQESVFTESRQPAKASVLVKVRAGDVLPDSAVPAITNLISSAVEGLAPESVAVLDMRGNLLSRPKRTYGGSGEEMSDSAIEYRRRVEQDLTAKLNSTLEPLVGAGRFRASVSADCDLTSGEQSEESFDPTRSVMVTSQKTEDTSSTVHVGEGVPGTVSNLPETAPPRPAPGGSGTSRKTENINYETSRTVKRTVLPQGAIKRLSVSVLIDQDAHWEGSGAAAKHVLEPPSAERLKVIHDLAAAATGLNAERGDQLIVESLPFESTLNLDPPAAQESAPLSGVKKPSLLEQLKKQPKIAIGAGAILLVILVGCFFALRRMFKRPSNQTAQVFTPPALPQTSGEVPAHPLPHASGVTDQDPLPFPGSTNSPLPALSAGKMEVLTKNLQEVARQDSEVCASVLRSWLREERP